MAKDLKKWLETEGADLLAKRKTELRRHKGEDKEKEEIDKALVRWLSWGLHGSDE